MMKARERVCLGLAVGSGIFVGFIELHSNEVSPTLAAVILTAALLGFASPRRFWLWAAVVGVSVPLCYVVGPSFGITPRSWPEPPGCVTYVAVGAFTMTCGLVTAAMGASLARATRE